MNEKDNFIAQTLEHFFKFFIILFDQYLRFCQKNLEETVLEEKNHLLSQLTQLQETIRSYEEALINEKLKYEKEYSNFKVKLLENQETISILSKELDEVNKKLWDSKDLDKADENFNNLIKNVNSFSNYQD